jgi:hypothetical protein
MEYAPGEENLQPRSLRLPEHAWREIEARAKADQRKPLDWLRLQVYRHVLNGRRAA